MELLKSKPAAVGLGLGGLAVLVSTLLAWLVVSNETGDEVRIRAWTGPGGTTIFLLGLLAIVCGLGVMGASGRGRIWWALLGTVAGVLALIAAVYGLVDPEGLAAFLLSEGALSELGVVTIDSTRSTAQAAFESGELSASVQIGLIVGLVAAVLAALGGMFSLRARPA
jgi:hypothetical protein